jgi:glycine/D-amino acid oxidase-like deaminating enzyme
VVWPVTLPEPANVAGRVTTIDDIASSYWLEDERPSFPKRRLSGRVDVAIVGAGVTGCSCALTLADAGLHVRVHEAREVAGGASGRNGGFALRGAAPPYDVVRTELGAERAASLWRLTERSLERMAELAGDAFRWEENGARSSMDGSPAASRARSFTPPTGHFIRRAGCAASLLGRPTPERKSESTIR